MNPNRIQRGAGHEQSKSGSAKPTAGAGVTFRTPTIEALDARAFLSAATPAVPWAQPPVLSAATVRTLVAPSVRTVSPANNTIGISCTTAVTADLNIPNGGVKKTTLSSASVYLFRTSDGARVPATVNTSAAGDVIVLKASAPLQGHTKYTFVVTAAVKDAAGVAFKPFRSSFTTGTPRTPSTSPVNFTKLPQAAGAGRNYFCLAFGPDGKLYAGADNGNVYRFPVRADGSLGSPTTIGTIRSNNGGAARFVVGLAFAPGSTADHPVLWVNHTATSALVLGGTAGANWTGKVSVLTGAGLTGYRDAVVNLPRSVRDHFTNQPSFGPDGALYFSQASQSAMGAADVTWGSRSETVLSGAILRLDVAALGTDTLDARTRGDGGTYEPDAAGAPLTVYADGVRNAFDLVWHRNGSLYAPANGSAAGGNTPAGPAGSGVPALTNVSKAETDYLFRIAPGKYYGHPNPRRGHYVLNGGNPTGGADPYEVADYPVGVAPDPKWQKAAFDMGAHRAPAGAIEYRGTAFGGALDGRLLVCRYSGGDDVISLKLRADGSVEKSEVGLTGLTGLADPVDIVQRPGGAGLYVIELAKRRITMLRAG